MVAVAEESQPRGAPPTIDPTLLTTEQLLRAIAGERDRVDGRFEVVGVRLDGMDKATELRSAAVDSLHGTIDEKVGHLAALTDERFGAIATQFRERDTRSERESRDNKVAVDAAFAAQKEAASEQNKSNTLAISKSETATTETINKLAELFKTTTDALGDKIDDLKERLGRVEAAEITERRVALGAQQAGRIDREVSRDAKQWRSDGNTLMLGVVGAIVGVGGLIAAAVAVSVK